MTGARDFGVFGRVLATVLVASSALSAAAQLTKEESAGIDRALGLWNLTVADLGYEKRLIKDPYRLPLIDETLCAPFDGLESVMKLQTVVRSRTAKPGLILETAWRSLQPAPKETSKPLAGQAAGFQQVPAACRAQVSAAIDVVLEADGLVNRALAKLSPQDRADLLRSLPDIAASAKMTPVRQGQGRLLSREKAFDLLGKVDFGLLEMASEKLAFGLPPIVEQMRAVAGKVQITKPIRFKASYLDVVIGSTGDDRFAGKENQLVIDFRGNDSYSGRVGSGIGSCGVLIDLGGSDAFDLGDYSGGFGLLGCGYVADLGGNDRMFAKSFSLGSALGGCGVFYKEGGNDSYRAGACTEGFAMFGVGLLEDTKGSDRYDATDFAQGSALTRGFGWLVDRQGDDFYSIGGRVSGAPLDPQSWYCFGQGAASGFREDSGGESGGIGILSDLQGDDSYRGGMYCQGASYWFSLGALMDDEGNDSYVADYYSQASAMHFTAAFLVDLKGDDAYTVRTGAMQADGHDYGVAILLDRQGDDVYSGRDSWPAQGTANGVAAFIDSAGNDRYFGPPAIAKGSRGTGSIALFVDLAGKDDYAHGLADGEASLTGMWGIAVDFPDPAVPTGAGAPSAHVRPKPGTKPMPSPAEMETIFRKASQWGVGTLQQEVQDNVDQLVAIGVPALDWMLKNKLATADRMSMRAFDAVISALGDPGKALIPPFAASKQGDAALNALTLAATHQIAAVEPYLKDALIDPKLQRAAIRAAGAAKAQSLVPALVGYVDGKDASLSLIALQSLDQIGSEDAVYTFVKMCTSPELPIRKTAVKALAKWPSRAMEAAKVLLTRTDRPLRVGIELLGEVGTEESLAMVVEQLKSKDAGARMEAERVLGQKDPAKYLAAVEPLAADPDPSVKALAEWAIRRARPAGR